MEIKIHLKQQWKLIKLHSEFQASFGYNTRAILEKNLMRHLWPQVGKTFVISHSWGNMSTSKRTLSKIRQCVGLGCWVTGITSCSPCFCSGYFSRECWLSLVFLILLEWTRSQLRSSNDEYVLDTEECALLFSTSVLNLPWDACLISFYLYTSWLHWFENFRVSSCKMENTASPGESVQVRELC